MEGRRVMAQVWQAGKRNSCFTCGQMSCDRAGSAEGHATASSDKRGFETNLSASSLAALAGDDLDAARSERAEAEEAKG